MNIQLVMNVFESGYVNFLMMIYKQTYLVGFFTLIMLVMLPVNLFAQSAATTRKALVISNSGYTNQPLITPKADGELIADALKSVGFGVRVVQDIESRDDFIRVLREFESESASAEIGLIYYAGHGISVNGENYLLPTKQEFKFEADVEDFALSTEKILRFFEGNSNRANILILDACRNNPFETNWNRTRGGQGAGLSKDIAPLGSLVAYSTSYGSTAMDGNGLHSPYASYLAKYLQFPNISLERVFARTREDVWESTDKSQRPIEENQLIGKEIILKEVRTLGNLTMDNYRDALDTACCTMKAQIYATMLEVNKGDSTKIAEISTEWYNREFGGESTYIQLIEFLGSDIYWNYSNAEDSVGRMYTEDDFKPITDVLDNIDRWKLPEKLNKELALHEHAFLQSMDVLSFRVSDSPLNELEASFKADIDDFMSWAWLYVWQKEMAQQDSISVDDYFLMSIASCEDRTSDNINSSHRLYGALYAGDIEMESLQVLLRHDNFDRHQVRKMQGLEVEAKDAAVYAYSRIRSDYDTVDYVFGYYAPFYNYGEGALFGLAYDNAKSIIESSGAWCDSASFSNMNDYFLNAWGVLLFFQKDAINYGNPMFNSSLLFYLNQARNWAILYDKPTYKIDSLANEYIDVFDSYITRIDTLAWWDIVEYDILSGDYFTYSTEVFDWRNGWDEANLKLWWSMRSPMSEDDIQLIYTTKKKIARTERQVLLDHLNVGVGQDIQELKYAEQPRPQSLITAHASRLNNGIEINDWLKFIEVDIIDNKDGIPLIEEINTHERERRVNLFLLTIVEPWFNELKESEYVDIGQFTTSSDLPLYWSVIDGLFHLVKDQGNVSYFAHLYMTILMEIQQLTGYVVDPEYFSVILDWYYLNFDSMAEHDRLYAQRILRQYQIHLNEDGEPYDYYTGENSADEEGVNVLRVILQQSILSHRTLVSEILHEED